MDKQIEAMKRLGFSETEIADVLESDRRIDKGEKLFELSTDQKQAAKKARQADRDKTAYTFTKRERKPNESKREIIAAFADTARQLADSGKINVVNAEREFEFIANGIKYKIVLSQPRK